MEFLSFTYAVSHTHTHTHTHWNWYVENWKSSCPSAPVIEIFRMLLRPHSTSSWKTSSVFTLFQNHNAYIPLGYKDQTYKCLGEIEMNAIWQINHWCWKKISLTTILFVFASSTVFVKVASPGLWNALAFLAALELLRRTLFRIPAWKNKVDMFQSSTSTLFSQLLCMYSGITRQD